MKRISKREIIWLAVAGAVVLGSGVAVLVRNEFPEWVYYQSEFRDIVTSRMGSVDPGSIPRGIQQIWVPDLNAVDRCITCHQGYDWKGLEDVEQPWSSHPDPELLKIHPPGKYGCTTCHGGQGFALTYAEAHGFVRHWEEPLLGQTIAEEYDPRTPPPLQQIKCNYCHRYQRETPGMNWINEAKALVRAKGCKVCHVINGSGGSLGPDLTHEGDKGPEGFDFSNFATAQPSVFNWHVNHFQQPVNVVPGSIMPEMNFQSREAMALAMLVMSWKDNSELPLDYLPGVRLEDEQTPEDVERERLMREGDGAFFVQHSCFICHSITAFDIKSPTNKGPDLSFAPEDVRARFSRDLEDFIFDPTGTMKIILESQIVLSDEQKWEALEKIRKAYDIVKNRRQQAVQTIP